MFQAHRSSDAILTIRQNNERRRIEIRALNPAATKALHFVPETVIGRVLTDFLPQRIRDLLEEYVEYENDGNDVGHVLARVQSFCLLDGKGEERAFRLKVLRSDSPDGHAYFQLILQDKTGGKREEAFRALLRENFRGHEVLDPETGLPDRQSIVKDLEMLHYYVNKEALSACFAVLDLDQYEAIGAAHGAGAPQAALRHIAALARQNLRTDDTIGRVHARRIGIILMDTTAESARMVLNRLRWLVAANPFPTASGEPFPITASIAFSGVAAAPDKEFLARVESSLPPGGANALAELS